jgi:squalene cyclase
METDTAERLMDLNTISLSGIALAVVRLRHEPVVARSLLDAAVRYIKRMQTPEGHWRMFENRRPPMNSGSYQATALSIYALQHYGREEEKDDTAKTVARARAWLETAQPSTTQDRAFRLMGLGWSNGGGAAIAKAVKELAAAQRADGGWSQLPTMGSDAYATGEALYALSAAGRMPISEPVYRKGIRYLVRTQAADGSWHVKSRPSGCTYRAGSRTDTISGSRRPSAWLWRFAGGRAGQYQ